MKKEIKDKYINYRNSVICDCDCEINFYDILDFAQCNDLTFEEVEKLEFELRGN